MNAEEKNTQEGASPEAETATKKEDTGNGASAEQTLREEMLYMRAEFENTKRRLIREQENAIRFANEKIVSDLVGVVDLFDRALTSGSPLKETGSQEVKNFFTGIEMTQRELTHVLSRFGVEFTGAVGEKFDPSRHEAVAQTPAEPAQVDSVMAVAQKGCTLQGRLLKPAKVVVGIAKE
jgi:molecular chaperone GrpE